MRALIGALWGLPSYLAARSNVQNRRRTQDQELFDYSHGERPYFNPITYQPIRKIEVLEAAYRRLALISGEERHRRIADGLVLIASYRLRFDRDFVRERLADLLSGEPERVQEFLDSLEV